MILDTPREIFFYYTMYEFVLFFRFSMMNANGGGDIYTVNGRRGTDRKERKNCFQKYRMPIAK